MEAFHRKHLYMALHVRLQTKLDQQANIVLLYCLKTYLPIEQLLIL